jgi:site-specific DNA-methyltransferase (adenine-specific)
MINPHFKSIDKAFTVLHGDNTEILPQFDFKFDMVFADPPYFLSNDGLTFKNGKIASVNKGDWDKISKVNLSGDVAKINSSKIHKETENNLNFINNFNRKWLELTREKMKEEATIFISATSHNLFSIGQVLNELNFKILNIITWEKTNPPPNFSCRYFTHASEHIIWARKNKKVPHFFNYDLMKAQNQNKQMKDVWKLPAIAPFEKACGKHPTQKPLALLTRIILASTKENAWILDPFTGASTTGIAANLFNRKFVGIDKEIEFLEISKRRKIEIENPQNFRKFKEKLT